MKNYYIIPADFKLYNFKDIKMQMKEKKDTCLLWYNAKISVTYDLNGKMLRGKNGQFIRIFKKGNNKKELIKKINEKDKEKLIIEKDRVMKSKSNDLIIEDAKIKKDITFAKNSIIYIYYTKLPDQMSRILLRAKFIEEEYFHDEIIKKEDKVPGIKIEINGVINYDKNKNDFSKETLEIKYNLGKIQCKRQPKEGIYIHKDTKKDLLEDLEISCVTGKNIIDELKRYFDFKCAFEDCQEFVLLTSKNHKEKHETFEAYNRLNFYEVHHLIQRNLSYYKKESKIPEAQWKDFSKEIEKILNREENLINLCPNCHNRIHHGTKEDITNMVTYLYNKHPKELNNILYKLQEKEIIKEIEKGKELEWILSSLYGA